MPNLDCFIRERRNLAARVTDSEMYRCKGASVKSHGAVPARVDPTKNLFTVIIETPMLLSIEINPTSSGCRLDWLPSPLHGPRAEVKERVRAASPIDIECVLSPVQFCVLVCQGTALFRIRCFMFDEHGRKVPDTDLLR